MDDTRFSKHQISIALLEIYQSENKSLNRYNVIGRPDQKGNLENKLNNEFTPRERALAYKTLRELEDKGMIIPTYGDISSPGDWLTITELGQHALKSGALDELDEVLLKLNSPYALLEMRHGARDAIASRHTDWQRQAATSSVELITKVLYTISPDKDVKADPEFINDSSSSNGITRKERIRHYLREKFGRVSNNDYKIIDDACTLVETCYTKLSSIKHTDNKEQVFALVQLTETALAFLLSNEYESV